VLSPRFWAVYIDDLPDELPPEVDVGLFADDVALWALTLRTARQLRLLQSGLDAVHRWALDWHVAFSAPKSKAVTFSRKRSRLVEPNLRLGTVNLANAPSYDYLGIVMARSGSWLAHTEKVLERVRKSAFAVARVLGGRSPVHPICARQLVTAIIEPQIAYGQPVWQPNSQANSRKLMSLLAMTLKRVLHLPRSADTMGVLGDFDVHSPEAIRELAMLTASARMENLTPEHAAFRCWRRLRAVQDSLDSTHVFRRMRRFFSDQRLVLPATMTRGQRLELVQQLDHQRWRSTGAKSLRALKTSPGLSRYLKLDDQQTACARARLRFNRARLNASLHERKCIDSPDCTACGVPETVHHAVCDCNRYANLRATAAAELRRACGIPGLTSVIALGRPPPRLTLVEGDRCLKITGRYLAMLTEQRGC
jgi:hypothetical protein